MSAVAEGTVPFVRLEGVAKTFGGVQALAGIDFHVGQGEVVALLGDNGAGKSTLVKLLSGVMKPDAGSITMRERKVNFRSARDAIDVGVETIFQSSALVNQLSVARNLFLGREPQRRFLGFIPHLDKSAMRVQTSELLSEIGLHRSVDPDSTIATLSGGERQSIAIARAMHFHADLIILDEPTNNLGVEETRRVLQFIRDVRTAGRSAVFITHNIFHVFQVVDRVVVLRHGRKIADILTADTSVEEVERIITGNELAAKPS